MSPSRRRMLQVLVGLLAVVVVLVVATSVRHRTATRATDQGVLGTVLLVPGYGGTTEELRPLLARIKAAGREALIVDVPDGGTGDLRVAARAVADAAQRVLAQGAPSVDVIGYSAGGVIARLYAATHGSQVRRVITLGSPHHGTQIAAAAQAFASGECTVACQQLAPGSSLLAGLAETPAGPSWVSLWSTDDEVVTPPGSSRLKGARNVVLQDVCPGITVSHGNLPTTALVESIVLQELAAGPTTTPHGC